MESKLILTAVVLFSSFVFAQHRDSKSAPGDISGYTSSSVSNNPANPEVNYPQDGSEYYAGDFKDAIKEGKGPAVNQDPVNQVVRSDNRDKAMRHRTPYRIVNSRYVSRSTITRSVGRTNGIRLRFMQNGQENTDIEDLSVATENGTEYKMGNIYGVENIVLPLYVKVTYRSWNAFHAVKNDVLFEFIVFSPGTWDITLFN